MQSTFFFLSPTPLPPLTLTPTTTKIHTPLRATTQQTTPKTTTKLNQYTCKFTEPIPQTGSQGSALVFQGEEFLVEAITQDPTNFKISAKVSSTKTQEIFDDVFSKMVADAQPIPGFRRVKGGKTPNIPKDILLEILGPSRVYKEVIKKIINSTIAQYISKEGLKVGKDLQVLQSFEDLEAGFEPGDAFTFDAILQRRE